MKERERETKLDGVCVGVWVFVCIATFERMSLCLWCQNCWKEKKPGQDEIKSRD